MKIKEEYNSIYDFKSANNKIENVKIKCPHCKNPIRLSKGEYITRYAASKCYTCDGEIVVKIDYSITLNLDVKVKKVV